jgi:hypothetical protein
LVRTSIDFEGLEEALGKLRNWPPEMRKDVGRAIGRGLQMIANAAKGITQKEAHDTGRFWSSIGAQTAFGINEVKHIGSDVVGRVGTRVEYGPYIEWGRRPGKMPPVSIIEEWAARHGMPGMGFVIARAIGRRGLKAKRVMERAMRDQAKNVVEHIEKAIEKAARRF